MSREDLFRGIGEREENEEQKEWSHRPHKEENPVPTSFPRAETIRRWEPRSPDAKPSTSIHQSTIATSLPSQIMYSLFIKLKYISNFTIYNSINFITLLFL